MEELGTSAHQVCREAEDGALRCQAAYTAERARVCDSILRSIDMNCVEMNKLIESAHAIVAGDYGGHRKTQLVADEIVALCAREASGAQTVFELCKELLAAKMHAVEIYRQETMRASPEQLDEMPADRLSQSQQTQDMVSASSSETVVKAAVGGGTSIKARGKYAALSAIRKKIAAHPKAATQVNAATEPVTELQPEETIPILPDGWAEYMDEGRGVPYYYNLYSHQTQWERPTEAAVPVEEKEEDMPPRLSDEHSWHSDDGMSMHSEEDDIREVDDVYVLPKPEGLPRGTSMRMGSMRITPDEFERVGMTTKTGILMKRSKYLRLWKKRFVAVEGNKLMYYKKSSDYNAGMRSSDKTMTLTPESMTAFTTVKNVFSIKQRDPLSTTVGEVTGSRVRRSVGRGVKSEQWFLMAKDDFEMHEWVTAISAHIHVVHMLSINYQKTRDDYLALGQAAVSFWTVPKGKPGAQKLPIGISPILTFRWYTSNKFRLQLYR